MKKSSKKVFNHEEWYTFAQSYINIAKLSCLEMLERKHVKFSLSQSRRHNFFEKADLYLSTIYNIKHAIEIVIKTLNSEASNDVTEYSHDLGDLIVKLKKNLNINKIKAGVEGSQLLNGPVFKEAKPFVDFVISGSNDFSNSLSKFESLVDKYYHCTFLNSKISESYIIEDQENTTFKYPENNTLIRIDYSHVLSAIRDRDVEDIKIDIQSLERLFLVLDTVLVFSKK